MRKVRILVDLKPAMDGHAGIPQESRLLFAGLRRMREEFETEGLLQDGSRHVPDGGTRAPARPHEKIFRNSRIVAALGASPRARGRIGLSRRMRRFLAHARLSWRVMRRRPVEMGTFDPLRFEDFLWRHVFARTLPVSEKELVTSARFRVIEHSRHAFHLAMLRAARGGLGACHPLLDAGGYDFLLAQTPFPARLTGGARLVVRYHDAIPVFMPHTIADVGFHQAMHAQALKLNMESGALFACTSETTRQVLLEMFPEAEDRTHAIPNMVSDAFHPVSASAAQIARIIVSRMEGGEGEECAEGGARVALRENEGGEMRFLLMVSTLEPRKNHELLISAWERLRLSRMPGLKLVLVGNRGWECDSILRRMRPWVRRGELFHLTGVAVDELRALYSHAVATICPSLDEGFGYPGVEAMMCNGLVIASDIPVHREIYGAGSAYFDPYDVNDAVETIGAMLSDDEAARERREALRAAGIAQCRRYLPENVMPLWRGFLREAVEKGAGERK